jgi:hypothetical protein
MSKQDSTRGDFVNYALNCMNLPRSKKILKKPGNYISNCCHLRMNINSDLRKYWQHSRLEVFFALVDKRDFGFVPKAFQSAPNITTGYSPSRPQANRRSELLTVRIGVFP